MNKLVCGTGTQRPEYDFNSHVRISENVVLHPAEWIILEGIFALNFEIIRNLSRVTIFAKAPLELCFERRLNRDVSERGRNQAEVAWRFWEHVVPNHVKFSKHLENIADLVVDTTGAIDSNLKLILSSLKLLGCI